MSSQLILTVTRACNLRCSYCPTAKDGWPSLKKEDVRTAIDIFVSRFGGGSIKLFGGEPLLVPEIVQEACHYAAKFDSIPQIYLSTNGLPLNEEFLDWIKRQKKLILTISIDGTAKDHNRMRRSLMGTSSSYEHVMSLRKSLLNLPRLVITQTIAPATASRAYKNFLHLYEQGFRKFNFLPGFYIPWRGVQLEYLKENFQQIADEIISLWEKNRYIYIRNLFIQAPTPFFNTGVIVDSDRSIHANNLGLSDKLTHLRAKTQVGNLDRPPTKEQLQSKAQEINSILKHELPSNIWSSTLAADAALSKFCAQLWPHFLRYKKRKVAQ